MSKYEDVVKNKGTWATYTEYATLGPRNAFFKVETDAPSEAFIALGCGLPAVMQAVDHLPNHAIENGENVVVQGAGAVGLSAIMLARIAGASKIVCIEANKFRMAKAKEFGADECLDVTETTQQERAERLKQIFGPRGSTLAVECTGTLKAVSEGLSFLSRKGKYILIGTWAGKGEVPFDPFLAVHKAITIQGSTYSSPRIYHNALRLVEQNYGRFPLASCVTHKFSLNKSQEGLETVLKGEVVKGVIQLSLRD
jgi:5-exo-hydroxycamphor dehydrogenase